MGAQDAAQFSAGLFPGHRKWCDLPGENCVPSKPESAAEDEFEVKKDWQRIANARQNFDGPSLKEEAVGSASVERLSSEKVQPIEASEPRKGRKGRFMPSQSRCSDEVCEWKPPAVTYPFRGRLKGRGDLHRSRRRCGTAG